MSVDFFLSSSLVPYLESLKIMEQRVDAVSKDEKKELIWFLEHPTIITAGTSANENDVLDKTIPNFQTNRGGKHTIHAQGQRVVYLMLNLKKRALEKVPDPRKYVADLEEIIINTLAKIGIKGEIKNGRVGVWVFNIETEKEEKIAAIGVRFSKGVTWHGFAINIKNDLNLFSAINPCGITEFGVCSIESLGVKTSMEEFDILLLEEIKRKFF